MDARSRRSRIDSKRILHNGFGIVVLVFAHLSRFRIGISFERSDGGFFSLFSLFLGDLGKVGFGLGGFFRLVRSRVVRVGFSSGNVLDLCSILGCFIFELLFQRFFLRLAFGGRARVMWEDVEICSIFKVDFGEISLFRLGYIRVDWSEWRGSKVDDVFSRCFI